MFILLLQTYSKYLSSKWTELCPVACNDSGSLEYYLMTSREGKVYKLIN